MRTKILVFIAFFILLTACDRKTEEVEVSPRCIEGQSACKITTEYGEVDVLFTRQRLIAESPFNVHVNIKSSSTFAKIQSHMEGQSMYMGKIPLLFKSSSQNKFVAQGLFGSCGQDKMIWRIWFTLTTSNGENHTFAIDVPSSLR